MNIITLKTGELEEFNEYIFKTTLDIEKIFSGRGNLTSEFIKFLEENSYNNLLKNYFNNRENFEIDYWYDENMDEVIL